MRSGLRLSIKWKLFALIALMISAALVAVLFRTSQIFREDKEAFVKELSAKLASSSVKSASSLIATLQDKLLIFISSRESLSRTGAKVDDQVRVLFSRYHEFLSIGFYKQNTNQMLEQEWSLRNPENKSETASWGSTFEKGFFEKLNVSKAIINGRAIWRMKVPDGNTLLVLGFSVQYQDPKSKVESKAWIVGVLPTNTFSQLLSDFATGLNTGVIIDDEGIAIGHSDRASLWKNYSKFPIALEALKYNRPASAGDFKDLSGRALIGSFENIPSVNLTVFVTTPRDKAFEAAEVMTKNILFIGCVILVMALALAILLSNYMTGPLQRLALIAAQIGEGNFQVNVKPESNDEIGDLASSFSKMGKGLLERDAALEQAQGALVQSEKMGAFGQLSAGIAHEVKNPLAGILGHAQLAMGKAQTDDMKKHLEVIEKETRRCKAIVENLMKFARQEKADMAPTDLTQVVQDTINLVDHQLSLAGCKILKDFKPVPMVNANGNQLQQVLLNLMVNCSHAMEQSIVKNVTVRVLKVGNKAQIQIEDTGVGIPPEIQKKIFEPFFTTKPAGKGTGLGLSVSIGIVKDHKGEIYLKSEMNKGTTFFIDIPIGESSVVLKQVLASKTSKPWVEKDYNTMTKTYKLASDEPVFTKTPPAQPPSAVVENSKSKIPSFPEDSKDDVFFGTGETLGGKVALESAAALPELPKEVEDGNLTSFFRSNDIKPREVTSGSSEFRVKIKRPKLKA